MPKPIVPVVVIVPPVKPAPAVIDVTEPGVNPSNPVISALVAFATTPVPLARSNVLPVTPLTVNPVNDGESPVPTPKFVLAAPAVTAPVPPFAMANVPVAFEKSELIFELNVVKSVEAK